MTKSAHPITIKKYANRRLYNMGTSTYVTLEDIAAMVKGGEDFIVQDAKTGEDITRQVLIKSKSIPCALAVCTAWPSCCPRALACDHRLVGESRH